MPDVGEGRGGVHLPDRPDTTQSAANRRPELHHLASAKLSGIATLRRAPRRRVDHLHPARLCRREDNRLVRHHSERPAWLVRPLGPGASRAHQRWSRPGVQTVRAHKQPPEDLAVPQTTPEPWPVDW